MNSATPNIRGRNAPSLIDNRTTDAQTTAELGSLYALYILTSRLISHTSSCSSRITLNVYWYWHGSTTSYNKYLMTKLPILLKFVFLEYKCWFSLRFAHHILVYTPTFRLRYILNKFSICCLTGLTSYTRQHLTANLSHFGYYYCFKRALPGVPLLLPWYYHIPYLFLHAFLDWPTYVPL